MSSKKKVNMNKQSSTTTTTTKRRTTTTRKKTQTNTTKGTNKNYNDMSIDELNSECAVHKLPVRGTANHLKTQLNYNKLSSTLLKEECRKNKLKMTGKKDLLLRALMFHNLHKSFRKSDDYVDDQKKGYLDRKTFLTDKEKKKWEQNNKNYYKKLIDTRQEYTFDKELNVYLSDNRYNSLYQFVITDIKDDRISKKYNILKKVFEDLTCSDIQFLKTKNLLYQLPPILEMNEPGDEKEHIRKRSSTDDIEAEEDVNDYFHEIFDL